MRLNHVVILLAACGTLSSCNTHNSPTYSLYRNSPLDPMLRVNWATFNARESDPNYNFRNCQMAAQLLNANMTASARLEHKDRDRSLGFWCESGGYKEGGPVPSSFPEAFPTDA